MSKELDLPVVGGKISFYNEDLQLNRAIKPTAAIVGVGLVENISKIPFQGFSNDRDLVAIVGLTYPELGGSEYLYRYHGIEGGGVPLPRPVTEILNSRFILEAIRLNLIRSIHDIDIGGLATAIAEMSIIGYAGVDIDLYNVPCMGCRRIDEVFFSETQGRYIIAFRNSDLDSILNLANRIGVDLKIIGKVNDNGVFRVRYRNRDVVSIRLDNLVSIYEGGSA